MYDSQDLGHRDVCNGDERRSEDRMAGEAVSWSIRCENIGRYQELILNHYSHAQGGYTRLTGDE